MVGSPPCSSSLWGDSLCTPLLFQVDFEQLAENLGQLEHRSSAAEESLRSLAKHELAPALRTRLTQFLAHCSRRVTMLRVVHRRVCNRWDCGPKRQDRHHCPSPPSRTHHPFLS